MTVLLYHFLMSLHLKLLEGSSCQLLFLHGGDLLERFEVLDNVVFADKWPATVVDYVLFD